MSDPAEPISPRAPDTRWSQEVETKALVSAQPEPEAVTPRRRSPGIPSVPC